MSLGAILGIFTAFISLAGLGVVLGSPNTAGIVKNVFDGFGSTLKVAENR